VPYKGTPEATTAVVRGDVQMYFTPIPMAQELTAAGKVRPIAINSNQRSAQLPDVPTVKESVPSYDYDSWFAILAPANTPRPILDKISKDVATVLKSPDVVEKLQAQGATASPTTPEALDAQVRRETEFYAKVLHDAGVGGN
jgi:tripartite-type tricarboxylate transporter receptor subunit TctC